MKFCFSGNLSAALKGRTPGGGELQIVLLARALALKGHEVVIIDPYASESFTTSEGVKLINIPTWNRGLKVLRLFLYRIPTLKKILISQNADYYYVRMRSYLHLFSYKVAKKLNKKFIVGVAHDIDLLSHKKRFKYKYSNNFNLFSYLTLQFPNDFVFDYLLKRADYITIQHQGQKIRRHSIKGRVVLFPNIIDHTNLPIVHNPSRNYFVHVGTLTTIKGIKNLYQLINMLDGQEQVLIIGSAKDNESKKILNLISQNKNVTLKGWLNHNETIEIIANSKALINLSNHEGFPNIFLEAWATGVPVLSLYVNPGNIFNMYELGLYFDGDLKKMKDYMDAGITPNIDKSQFLTYIVKFHSFEKAADRFLNLLNQAS